MQPITFAGAGALGQGLASHLYRSSPVTLLARPATADRLVSVDHLATPSQRVPLRPGPGEPGTLGVIASAADAGPDDVIVFTTKATQLAELAEQVHTQWHRDSGVVAGLQNGMAKDDVLKAVFGEDAVVGALTMTAAGRDASGRVQLTAVGQTYFGTFDGRLTQLGHQLAEQFRLAGLPASVSSDIANATWMKCCNSAALFGASALTRLDTTSLFGRPSSLRAFLDLLEEAAAVAYAAGASPTDHPGLPPIATFLGPDREKVIGSLLANPRPATTPPSFSSMAQDVLAGRPTEVDAVIGDLVGRADSDGLPVPRLRLVRDLIRSLDEAAPAATPGARER